MALKKGKGPAKKISLDQTWPTCGTEEFKWWHAKTYLKMKNKSQIKFNEILFIYHPRHVNDLLITESVLILFHNFCRFSIRCIYNFFNTRITCTPNIPEL